MLLEAIPRRLGRSWSEDGGHADGLVGGEQCRLPRRGKGSETGRLICLDRRALHVLMWMVPSMSGAYHHKRGREGGLLQHEGLVLHAGGVFRFLGSPIR
jgi:hypothetical protein